jgi:hypothetical protein
VLASPSAPTTDTHTTPFPTQSWLDHKADRLVSIPEIFSSIWEADPAIDAPGATYLAYTPDGKKLVTAGVDNYCRVFSSGSDDEPVTVDNCQEDNTAVVAGVRTALTTGGRQY